MLVQEILKIVRRRGMFWSYIGITAGAVLAIVVTSVVLEVAGADDRLGGRDFLDAASGVLLFSAFVMGVLIGAQEGAYDVSQGTFRYMVMTGHSRLRLYLMRFPAYLAVLVAGMVPAVVLMLVAAPLMPSGPGDPAAGASDYALAVWTPFVFSAVFGVISLAVGALLRSVGGAIAVALALNLAGFNLLLLVAFIDESLADFVLITAVGVLTGGDETSVAQAVAVAAAWLAAFVAAGALRTTRAEY
jgi:hypothetical protein